LTVRKVSLALIACLLVFAVGELGLRHILFKRVSYSNSESIDTQLHARNAEADWNLLFVGDSEVRWGINPEEIDAAFRTAGVRARTFNHAFDGFGASWWPQLLPPLLDHPSLEKVDIVLLGVQLIDVHRLMRESGEDCGALQKPVLTSPFAVDLGVDALCRNRSWDAELGRNLCPVCWTVRYPSAVRSLLLPEFMQGVKRISFNSRQEGEPVRGYAPHRTIAQDRESYNAEFERWKAQWVPERDLVPLPPQAWPSLTAPNGFFDELHQTVLLKGRRLVLFAVPTNPTVIDTFNRRADYKRNSLLLQEWAAKHNVVFIDMGIQDVANSETYFSDMRHLSSIGSRQYSRQLGQLLAQRGVLDTHKTSTSNATAPLK
jgi:hypothetical protein